MSSRAWTAFSAAAAAAGATVARKAFTTFWRSATGKNPPTDAADPEVELREAILWAVLSAGIVAVVKVLATRRAASYYYRSTGKSPNQTTKP